MKKPSKVTAIEIMCLVAGIFGVTFGFTFMWTIVWIPWIYAYVYGIIAIVIGAKLLSSHGYVNGAPPTPLPRPPHVVGVMAIVNILNCDFIGVTLGILILVFLGDPEVQDYFAGRWVPPPMPAPVYPGAYPPGYPPPGYPYPPPPQAYPYQAPPTSNPLPGASQPIPGAPVAPVAPDAPPAPPAGGGEQPGGRNP